MVKALLGHGADRTAVNNYGNSALCRAARFGHEQVAVLLLGGPEANPGSAAPPPLSKKLLKETELKRVMGAVLSMHGQRPRRVHQGVEEWAFSAALAECFGQSFASLKDSLRVWTCWTNPALPPAAPAVLAFCLCVAPQCARLFGLCRRSSSFLASTQVSHLARRGTRRATERAMELPSVACLCISL